MSDLPEWDGALIVYKRLMEINSKLSAQAYTSACFKHKSKKKIEWVLPENVSENIAAMNRGDEEACKAGVARDINLVTF